MFKISSFKKSCVSTNGLNIFNNFKLYYTNRRRISKSNNNTINNFNDIIINDQYLYDSEAGITKHYPSTIREWTNSIYNYNKNNLNNSIVKHDKLDKIIKSYFNLHNNIKLARSKRMRYLRIKSVSKRLYVSRPEIKQTNDKIIITVYYFDKLKHNFNRKNFFFNRPNMVKYILNKKYRKRTLLSKTRLIERRIKYLGIKQIKESKLLKERNKFKNKYVEQTLWLYFFKYLLSLINIHIYNPIYFYNINKNNLNKHMKFILRKESLKIKNIINLKPEMLFFFDLKNYSFERIEKHNINYPFLINKVIKNYLHIHENKILNLNYLLEINKKLWMFTNVFKTKNMLSESIILKAYNYISMKMHKNIQKKLLRKQYNKISKLILLSMSNILKFKKLLPALKLIINALYNKKTELNMVNLKYFFLNSDIFTQALITKLKKKVNPKKAIKKSLNKVKLFLAHNNRKRIMLNNIYRYYEYANIDIHSFPINIVKNNTINQSFKDWLDVIFNKIYPHNLLQKYNKINTKFKKISKVLNDIKYKGILGIRVEAKGRLTRRHKAARSIFHLTYKGNLKNNELFYNKEENLEKNITTVLLRNDIRANTQYTSKSSIRRIGSFGLKTWISGK